MATNFVAKLSTPSFVVLAFRNGMEYRYVNVRLNSANDASTSCKNFACVWVITIALMEVKVKVRG